jgi:hypothetical protein
MGHRDLGFRQSLRRVVRFSWRGYELNRANHKRRPIFAALWWNGRCGYIPLGRWKTYEPDNNYWDLP